MTERERLKERNRSRLVMEAWSYASEAHGCLEKAILATPTGELRNQLTDANILLLDAIEKLRAKDL